MCCVVLVLGLGLVLIQGSLSFGVSSQRKLVLGPTLTQYQNSRLNLVCEFDEVEDLSLYSVQWFEELENGTKIEIVEDKDQNATQYYFIEVSKNCTTLFITPRARASGKFICRVTREKDEKAEEDMTEVKLFELRAVSEHGVHLGHNTTIGCLLTNISSKSNLSYKIQWADYNGTVITENTDKYTIEPGKNVNGVQNSTLAIKNVKSFGNYTCTVYNNDEDGANWYSESLLVAVSGVEQLHLGLILFLVPAILYN